MQIPEWLSVENIGKMIVAENDETSFTPVPRHFLEIARIILYHFKDDIVDGDQVLQINLNRFRLVIISMRSFNYDCF